METHTVLDNLVSSIWFVSHVIGHFIGWTRWHKKVINFWPFYSMAVRVLFWYSNRGLKTQHSTCHLKKCITLKQTKRILCEGDWEVIITFTVCIWTPDIQVMETILYLHLKNEPFDDPPTFDHLNTGLLHYSDPHCISS